MHAGYLYLFSEDLHEWITANPSIINISSLKVRAFLIAHRFDRFTINVEHTSRSVLRFPPYDWLAPDQFGILRPV